MFKNSAIYNELLALTSPLADISNKNMLSVPEGYFTSLFSNVLQSIHGQSLISDLDKEANMDVPEGYFDGLADSIMQKIKAGIEETELTDYNIPFLTAIRQKNVFTVPKGYFEEFADTIMQRVNASKLEESSLLHTIPNKNPFTVPEGYFANLADNILRQLPRPAAVVTMKTRPAVFKYAVAAAITGIIGFSLFSSLDQRNTSATIVSSFSPVMAQAGKILQDKSFDTEMATLDDEEIVGYLKNSGEDVNAALVASVTDDQTLPNEDAYYTDEKTLDDFLSGLNVTQNINN